MRGEPAPLRRAVTPVGVFMAKKVIANIKLQVQAGKATPVELESEQVEKV